MSAQPCTHISPTTWRFDFTLRLLAFSCAEDAHLVFLGTLKDAQDSRWIPGLQDQSFSCAVPEQHTFPFICTSHARLARLLSGRQFHNRIIPANTRRTPVKPGEDGDWGTTASWPSLQYAKMVADNSSKGCKARAGERVDRRTAQKDAQPNGCGGGRHARTGGSASAPHQNAS